MATTAEMIVRYAMAAGLAPRSMVKHYRGTIEMILDGGGQNGVFGGFRVGARSGKVLGSSSLTFGNGGATVRYATGRELQAALKAMAAEAPKPVAPTEFSREELDVEIQEVRQGDILLDIGDPELDGVAIRAFRPEQVVYQGTNGTRPGTGYRIYFDNGVNDVFGAPQKLRVSRRIAA